MARLTLSASATITRASLLSRVKYVPAELSAGHSRRRRESVWCSDHPQNLGGSPPSGICSRMRQAAVIESCRSPAASGAT